MSLLLNLSIIGMVVTFLVGVLMSFPGAPSISNPPTGDEEFSVERVHQFAGLFSGSYSSLIDELTSFQTNPDFARAELRRQEMTAYGNSLIGQLQDFDSRLEGKLNELTLQDTESTGEAAP